MSLQKNLLTLTTIFSLGLAVTGCNKHENAEGGNEKFRTEEIAAKQGEVARAAVKAPEAKEPATFTATTAPSSGTAATTSSATMASTANTATASSSANKTETTTEAKTNEVKKVDEKAVVKQTTTTTVTTKADEKK